MTNTSNMKRTVLLLAAAAMTATTLKAQMAKWIIPPVYSAIHKMGGGDFIITDSADYKILWSWDGQRLLSTSNQLYPFSENLSVAMPKGSGTIAGFYDTDGHFTPLQGYNVALGFPQFSSGFLLVKEGQFYRFINRKGVPLNGKYVVAYPFSNGYATCYTYRNMEKQKDPHNLLLTAEGEEVPISYNGKTFGDNAVEFISSVNDENTGYIVADHKLYRFNGTNRTLTPVFARKSETNMRDQARLEHALSSCLVRLNDTTTILTASCGAAGNIQIWFDNRLIPKSIQTLDGIQHFKKNTQQNRNYASPLRVLKENGKMGLFWDTIELLPPQLDQVTTCYSEIAFVRQGGRYGALKAYNDRSMKVSINDGMPVAFKHRTQPVTLQVELPDIVAAQQVRLITSHDSGLDIDEQFGRQIDERHLQFDGILTIPESLPAELYDDGSNNISYPVSISYDGLLSPTIDVNVKAWHKEYHTISVDESSISVSTDGLLQFNFTVTADLAPDELNTPINVSIQADGLQWNVEKLSDTLFKGTVHDLYDGPNSIVIAVEEQGCPPLFHRFSATYNKPAEKKSTPRPNKTTPKTDDKGKNNKPKRDTPVNPILEI